MTTTNNNNRSYWTPQEERKMMKKLKEIMDRDYYPKEVTDKDLEDYLAKEKNDELISYSAKNQDELYDSMEYQKQLFIKGIEKRINDRYKEYKIRPRERDQIDLNEEIAMFSIKQQYDVLKQMKTEFQVEKLSLFFSFKDEENIKQFTGDEIDQFILNVWNMKDAIDKVERELKDWEKEVKQKYVASVSRRRGVGGR